MMEQNAIDLTPSMSPMYIGLISPMVAKSQHKRFKLPIKIEDSEPTSNSQMRSKEGSNKKTPISY